MKKLLAVLLSLIMIFSTSAVAAAGDFDVEIGDGVSVEYSHTFYGKSLVALLTPLKMLGLPTSAELPMGNIIYLVCEYTDLLINGILNSIYNLFPDLGWASLEDYKNEQLLDGTDTFIDAPAEGASWSLGYSKKSIVPDNVFEKDYYFGGYIFPLVPVETVYDDQCVRVICVSDGSGRGVSIFASVDGIGIGNGDVREIRKRLMDYADKNDLDVNSINVSCTHTHKAIDTQGLSGKFILSVFTNAFFTQYPFFNGEITSGRDAEFMEGLFSRTCAAAAEAYADMTEGKLYYSAADATKYLTDKRDPQVFDPNINTLRFDPDDASEDTYISNIGAHPTSISREDTAICSDYPHYMEKEINESTGGNFIFFQGAQGAITTNRGQLNLSGEVDSYGVVEALGRCFGKLILEGCADETEVEPILNIKHAEVFVPADNAILKLAIKAQLVNNIVVRTGDNDREICIATEIGYAEFGSSLAVMLLPGEVFPEIVWGGAYAAEDSWSRTSWDYPALSDLDAVGDRHVIAFGLTNDATGYILPDNDYAPWIADSFEGMEHYEETLSGGTQVASTIVEGYMEMLG